MKKEKKYRLFDDEVTVHKTSYQSNGTLAVLLYKEGELWGDVTVNLQDPLQSDTLAFVDENNLPGIGKWLERNMIAKPMNYRAVSGFCTYPLYQFL